MTEEEQQVLIWFLGRSGVLRVDIYDEAGFEEWYQEVRFGGRPWSWHEKVYTEREAGTADPREVQIQDMGERVGFPPNFTIFGRLTKGEQHLKPLGEVAVDEDLRGEKSRPVTPLVIQDIEITTS